MVTVTVEKAKGKEASSVIIMYSVYLLAIKYFMNGVARRGTYLE